MLARHLWRRPNINPALVQCIVFAGISIVPHPSSLWHSVMQWGKGGRSNDGTASLYCVRFYTHNLWNVIVLYKPLWEQEVFLKVIFSANYASLALLMNN